MNNLEICAIHSKIDKIFIHPTAIVDPSAELADGVKIGAYTIIGKNVKIGKNTNIFPHVIIDDNSIIGEDNQIHYGAVIGSESQDLKTTLDKSYVIIGNRNTIREYVTVNRSSFSEGETVIGDDNLLMAYSHIAHDCIIGNKNIFSNSVNFGGHCIVENNNVIGGLTGIHQFVRIGSYSMIGGLTRVTQDVPSYFTIVGNPAKVEGVNIKGLKRHYFTREQISILRNAYKIIYLSDFSLAESIKKLEEIEQSEDIIHLIRFLKANSKRGIIGLNFKSLK